MKSSTGNPFGITAKSSTVFIDAHPGSSIRTCGGAMLLGKRLGAKVSLIDACDGAAMLEDESQGPAMAVLRRKEINSIMGILDIDPKNLFMLGFPDGGLEPMRNDYWRPTGLPYFCPWLKTDRVISPQALHPDAKFFGLEFFDLLMDLLDRLAPTHVFIHHDRDTNHDHRAINWFVRKALGDLAFDGRLPAMPTVFEWITYYTRMPWPPAGPDIPLAEAKKLAFPGRIVRYVPPTGEQSIKVHAWKQCLKSHGAAYVRRWTKTAEVFWVNQGSSR
jgi:LmbE family N-acetylglucosaminyl deacetylase